MTKNEPHQEKKLSFFFQCGRAITRKHTLQPGAPRFNRTTRCSGAFAAPQRARSQGKTRKKQQSKFKWCFLFLLRRGCPSLSQGKMMVRALLQQEGAFSAPQGVWDGTTQQSKRNNRRQGKKKKKQQSKSVFSFPPEERAPFSAKER